METCLHYRSKEGGGVIRIDTNWWFVGDGKPLIASDKETWEAYVAAYEGSPAGRAVRALLDRWDDVIQVYVDHALIVADPF
jgi:hypothetical protein